jgi:hypothetical protein
MLNSLKKIATGVVGTTGASWLEGAYALHRCHQTRLGSNEKQVSKLCLVLCFFLSRT